MENILEVQQICKSFPKTKFVLDKVSFSIPYGSIMGFVGENGGRKDNDYRLHFEHYLER